MDIVSSCPFPVTSVVWQSAAGGWALTLVCKATFRLDLQDSMLADQQEPINDEDNHWNDDPARSLAAPSDLVPFKPRADILVVGHAFAPERQPVRALTAAVSVGQMSKALDVYCDRWFDLDGCVHEGSRFVKMPLRYERAAGGADSDNPVGLRFDTEPDAYGRVMIPNLQPLGAHIGWRGDRFDPIGFGPIAPHWPTRHGKLHSHARRFSPRDWAKHPLPDIDLGYFNSAPRDQQVDAIRADERILLEHLHRDHARFITRLPGARPVAIVDRAQGGREEMRLVADTLWIDTDRALCTVVWRGGIGLHHPRDAGTIHVAVASSNRLEGASAAVLTLPLTAAPAQEPRPAAGDATVTLTAGLEPSSEETLPFVQSAWAESPYARSEGATLPSEDAGGTLFLTPDAAAKAVLPFPPATSWVHESRAAEHTPAAVGPATIAAPPPGEVRPLVSLGTSNVGLGPRPVALSAAAADPPASRVGEEDTQAGVASDKELPAPPPMIGPLARPDMEPAAARTVLEPAEEAPAEVIAPPKPPSPPPPSRPDLEKYTIERCGKIAVSIACRPSDTTKILEEHHLTGKDWDHVKSHWLEAIRQDLGCGKNAMLKRYDLAYVEQLEAERGPIGVEEYAKLAVAAERGRVGEAVAEMRLPAGAPIRIERMWMERVALDPVLAARVRTVLEHERTT